VVVDARQKPAGVPLQTTRELQFGDGRGDMGGGFFEIADQLIFGQRRGAETI